MLIVIRRLATYGAAVALTAAGVAVLVAFEFTFQHTFLSLLMIGVLLSAWIGGLGPGLLASLLSALSINYLFQEPRFEFSIDGLDDGVQLAVFVVAAVLLSALTRSRDRERRQAAELLRLKSDFVSMVSHDLRTPIAAIKGSIDLLFEDHVDQLNPRQRRFMHTIRRSNERLGAMVDDLLDLAQLEAGRIELDIRPADARRVVNEAVRCLGHQFKAKKQQIHVVCDTDLPPILVDRRRIEQALVNVLGNASKYTPERGEISVSARRLTTAGHGTHDEQVEIAVSDTGPGIRPRDQPRIFEKFFRGGDDATRSQQAGAGLGLAIALSLVELHGGALTLSNGQATGARCCISLPARAL